MCHDRNNADSLHLKENDLFLFISKIIPCLCPVFPTPVHHSHLCQHALHPEILSYHPSPTLTWMSSPYFVSFLSHTFKSFHLDKGHARWFTPIVQTYIQQLKTVWAFLCFKVCELVSLFKNLNPLESTFIWSTCIFRFNRYEYMFLS